MMFGRIKKPISLMIITCLVMLPINGYADLAANAVPAGGVVTIGSGSIGAAYDNGGINTVDITQTSAQMVAEWGSFNIGSLAEVNFKQPNVSSMALNRIFQGSPSKIFGALNATGRIFLVNQNGVIFGADSSVNVSGLVASSLNITDSDFTSGNMLFNCGGSCGAVINNGSILAQDGGYIVLLGSRVENNGSIVAKVGKVILGAGEQMTISLDAGNLISIAVGTDLNPDKADAGIINTGSIDAVQGKVVLNSVVLNDVFDNAINNTGIIEAKHIDHFAKNGDVVLTNAQVLASSNGEETSVDIIVKDGNVKMTDSKARAIAAGDFFLGNARVNIETDNGDITIDSGAVRAGVEGDYGTATVTIKGVKGDIKISGDEKDQSEFFAEVVKGTSDITINSVGADNAGKLDGGNISIDNTVVRSYVEDAGDTSVEIKAEGVRIGGSGDYFGGNVAIDNSTVLSEADGGGHAGIMIVGSDSPKDLISSGCKTDLSSLIGSVVNIINGSRIHAQSNGGTTSSVVELSALNDINVSADSEASAVSLGDDNPAFVVAAAGGNINGQGLISAMSEYVSAVALLGIEDVFAANVETQGSGSLDVFDSRINSFFSKSFGLTLDNQYEYSNAFLIASLIGDVTLGDIRSDAVFAAALGLDGLYSCDQAGKCVPDGDGDIYNTGGDISSQFTYLLARNRIGEEGNPILTDTSILAGYSYEEGDIFIRQDTDKLLELGMFLPFSYDAGSGPYLGFGASVAAKEGDISVFSEGDIIYNSLISPHGKVFMSSADGSVTPGIGWDPSVALEDIEDASGYADLSCLADKLLMNIEGSDIWSKYDKNGTTDYFSPFALVKARGPNIVALTDPEIPYLQEDKIFKNYYELLDFYRFSSFDSSTPIFFAYHPLTPSDSSAFDDIALDVGAYEFIDGSLNMRNPLAPYFGQEDEKDK